MTHTAQRYHFHDRPADYARLAQELGALLAGESDPIANAANTAALIFEALVVPDVHEFPGHIACDAASRSEIVVPLIVGSEQGDSPRAARFVRSLREASALATDA